MGSKKNNRISAYMIILLLTICFYNSDAQSFNRQEIIDPENDLVLHNTNPDLSLSFPDKTITLENQLNLQKCLDEIRYIQTDITAFSYLSNGRVLDVTLWLSSNLQHQKKIASPLTSDNVKSNPWSYLSYTMSIDINSVYETGSDYFFTIYWEPVTQTWTSRLQEGSSTGIKRMIEKNDITGSFDMEKNFIIFSLDLDKIGNPDQYNIILQTYYTFVDDEGKICQLLDISNWAQSPPPRFKISTLPSSIIIRPGEEANVEVQIESTTNVKSNVQITAENPRDLQLTFVSEKAFVPSNGIGTVVLKIKAEEFAESRSYTIPLYSNFTFETTSQIRGSNSIQNSKSASIVDLSNIVVTVNPQITYQEQLGQFMNMYGSVIGLIGGAVGATTVKFWLDSRHERKNEERKREN